MLLEPREAEARVKSHGDYIGGGIVATLLVGINLLPSHVNARLKVSIWQNTQLLFLILLARHYRLKA